MKKLVLFALLTLIAAPSFAVEKSWEGTWLNRKRGTSGKLQCTATEEEDGQWKADFTGEFQGQPFKYSVKFDSQKKKKDLQLSGTAKVDGMEYEWTGLMKGKSLTGEFTCFNGNNGSFTLSEGKKKKKK